MTIETAIAELAPHFGDRLSRSAAMREQHCHDEAHHMPHLPDAVIWPRSTEEVTLVARTCHDHGCPIVARGAGSSLEGHVIPVQGGISLDFAQMDQVLAVNAEDMDVVVQPGITRKRLNEELRDTGLFFPVDPGADASLGGMASTRASGTCAVRYGTMRESVLALEVVLADGRVIRTGTRARKSSAGYDLTRLFVGSEGTLGIITELTLRLHGVPEAISAATCAFERLEDAVNTVIETIQIGVPIARIELLDELSIRGFNGYAGYDRPERPTLFLEFHGSDTGVAEQAETVGEIAGELGCLGFEWTTNPEARNRFWSVRHNIYYAQQSLRPGATGYVTDACVADLAADRSDPGDGRGSQAEPAAGAAGRPCRRWQLPPGDPDQPGGCGREGRGAAARQAHLRARHPARRHGDRRARGGPRQAPVHAGRAWLGLGGDGRGQAQPRPARHPQPGQVGAGELSRFIHEGGWVSGFRVGSPGVAGCG